VFHIPQIHNMCLHRRRNINVTCKCIICVKYLMCKDFEGDKKKQNVVRVILVNECFGKRRKVKKSVTDILS